MFSFSIDVVKDWKSLLLNDKSQIDLQRLARVRILFVEFNSLNFIAINNNGQFPKGLPEKCSLDPAIRRAIERTKTSYFEGI